MDELSVPSKGPLSTVIICPHCEKPALQAVRGEATIRDEYQDPFLLGYTYIMLQCAECQEVSLQIKVDEVISDPGYEVPKFVYPARRQLSNAVPEPLRREFDEARSCFDNKTYTAAVVMVRRTLEGICKDNSVNEKVLAKSIEKMVADGLIDRTLAEWADGLRVLGNQGAHFTGTQVSREDANDALAFVEALLDQIYVLGRRFNEFKKRRATKAEPSS